MRPRVRIGPIALALLSLVGCGTTTRTGSFPTRVFQSARSARAARPPRARPWRPSPRAVPAVALVERALHDRGVRFGTDGSLGALAGYLRENGRPVPAALARPGDVLLFDLTNDPACQDHVAVVEAVDPDGRITFREVRDGQVRRSYVHAGEPSARRDSQGRVLNTFLRPKRPEDGPSTRYYAGQMLCAVLRLDR